MYVQFQLFILVSKLLKPIDILSIYFILLRQLHTTTVAVPCGRPISQFMSLNHQTARRLSPLRAFLLLSGVARGQEPTDQTVVRTERVSIR